jgi:hypothetical protein
MCKQQQAAAGSSRQAGSLHLLGYLQQSSGA